MKEKNKQNIEQTLIDLIEEAKERQTVYERKALIELGKTKGLAIALNVNSGVIRTKTKGTG